MQPILPRYFVICLFLLFTGCIKDQTRFYPDAEDPGLAIFSNTGNNVFSAVVNGNTWRTYARTLTGFNVRTNYEVEITRREFAGGPDSLTISWRGYFPPETNRPGSISLQLALPRGSTLRYLNELQGQRLAINTSTGRLSAIIPGVTQGNLTGTGNVYFQTAQFDSLGPVNFFGELSGLLEADFNSFRITKGRFDHSFEPGNLYL